MHECTVRYTRFLEPHHLECFSVGPGFLPDDGELSSKFQPLSLGSLSRCCCLCVPFKAQTNVVVTGACTLTHTVSVGRGHPFKERGIMGSWVCAPAVCTLRDKCQAVCNLRVFLDFSLGVGNTALHICRFHAPAFMLSNSWRHNESTAVGIHAVEVVETQRVDNPGEPCRDMKRQLNRIINTKRHQAVVTSSSKPAKRFPTVVKVCRKIKITFFVDLFLFSGFVSTPL